MKNIRNHYRYPIILLKQLVKTDFKLRYQGSVLGYSWSLLRPMILFLILYIVFVKFLRIGGDTPHFAVYLLLGIVVWGYFAEVTIGSVSSIVARGDLLRKINFPKYVIVLAGSFSAFINLLLNFVVIAVFMYIDGVDLRFTVILFPILLLELYIFSLALAFVLSAVFVRFRDMNYIWEVVMQAAFYATPILYPLSLVPLSASKILMLNPMAQIIQDLRYILITPQAVTVDQIYNTQYIRLIPITIVLLSVIFAALYFRKRSKFFAEDV